MHPLVRVARIVRWSLTILAITGWLAFLTWLLVRPAAADEPAVEEPVPVVPTTPVVHQPRLICIGHFRVTAYCPCRRCCGRWAKYQRTASGLPARGPLMAIDPRVLNMGDEFYVQGLGWKTAADTGSAIKGRRLDILMKSHRDAERFGVKKLKVYRKEGD